MIKLTIFKFFKNSSSFLLWRSIKKSGILTKIKTWLDWEDIWRTGNKYRSIFQTQLLRYAEEDIKESNKMAKSGQKS